MAAETQGAVVLSALYAKGGKTYARFCEFGDERGVVAFDWMGEPVALTAVDYREREQGELGRRLLLRPWQVQTVLIGSE
jgi:hypothetical protein